MVTLDQVEKLRQKADVSYDEAKAALEESNGDLLEAIISLEKQNKIKTPEDGGYYNSKKTENNKHNKFHKRINFENRTRNGTTFTELFGKFFRWCGVMIGRGNRNHFEVNKNSETIISIPVTVLVVFFLFGFWIITPLLVVGLFFGFRYTFNGPDLGKDSVNKAMGSAAEVAERIKKDFKGEETNEDSNN